MNRQQAINYLLSSGFSEEQIDTIEQAFKQDSTTNNDLALIHTEGLDEEIRCTMCTNHMKSDRNCDGSCAVNKDMYKAVMDAIEKRIQPTTKNDCETCIHNKGVLECDMYGCKYESTTKNDLGVDCISRTQVQTEIEMNASRYTIAKERGGMGQVEWSDQLIKVSDAVDIIRELPSVTPQESKTGHWIFCEGIKGKDNVEKCSCCQSHWKEAVIYKNDTQEYLRLRLKFCPNCGVKMVEPQESEDKE